MTQRLNIASVSREKLRDTLAKLEDKWRKEFPYTSVTSKEANIRFTWNNGFATLTINRGVSEIDRKLKDFNGNELLKTTQVLDELYIKLEKQKAQGLKLKSKFSDAQDVVKAYLETQG